jgi:hypothetical protein
MKVGLGVMDVAPRARRENCQRNSGYLIADNMLLGTHAL